MATNDNIPALLPRGPGHQFVVYADACSGAPGGRHETYFAALNRVIQRLRPAPEFICFPGDEVIGLTAERAELERQWRYFLDEELGWLDRSAMPLYPTSGNHTCYDAMSAAVFAAMLDARLPGDLVERDGLSYAVRRCDLLLVAVDTLNLRLGGEGRVDVDWLERTLAAQHDARYKLVQGHHPVFPVNGFSGELQREVHPEDGRQLWDVLVRHGVVAYLCSHILAFDVQVRQGVPQLLTAGAGTLHRMPEESEYLHAVQLALDAEGLRYQVLDATGAVRERLTWPPAVSPAAAWARLAPGVQAAPAELRAGTAAPPTVWRFQGVCPVAGGAEQTLLSAWDAGPALPALWIGLRGAENRLAVLLAPAPGRSPHLWLGPSLAPSCAFELQLALHPGMGPGGVLWREADAAPWSSLTAASPWGSERLVWPASWSVGHDKGGLDDRPFRGEQLSAWCRREESR